MKAYTRDHPSPRYQRLLALYREMHREGEVHLGIPPDQTLWFPEFGVYRQRPDRSWDDALARLRSDREAG